MNQEKWEYYLETSNNYEGGQRAHISHITGFFSKHDKGGKILDVGCGNKELANFTTSEYVGLDFPDDMHELPYEDKSFDLVVCNHVLEHTLSPVICLEEMKRVCKDDGFIMLGLPFCPHFMSEDHVYMLDPIGWKHLFKYANLQIVEQEELSYLGHYLLKAGETKW